MPQDGFALISGAVLLLCLMAHCVIVARMPDDLIGSAEAANLLGKSKPTIHRLVANGRLKPAATAPGGQHGAYLFHRADVERLAKEAAA